ncbi:MAG TPA: hypothetical protein VJ617_06455, partial [Arthrobacter sp.]|nr:hypothetical protein [Arthrobacter sp.]
MRRSRTDSIGLIVSDGGEPAFAEMIRGVEETAASQGITLLLANSADNPQREARAGRPGSPRAPGGRAGPCACGRRH